MGAKGSKDAPAAAASAGGSLSEKEKSEWRRKYQLSQREFEEVQRAFERQKGADDTIDRPTFLSVVTRNGVSREFADALFDSFDSDRNGRISIREYLVMTGVSFGGTLDQKLEASFRLFDRDGSGELSRDEILHMLEVTTLSVMRQQVKLRNISQGAPNAPVHAALDEDARRGLQRLLEDIMRAIDADGNGSLSLAEFKRGFKDHPDICLFFSQF